MKLEKTREDLIKENSKLLEDLCNNYFNRCLDKNGNDITDKYTGIAELIPADENGIKEYRGVKYSYKDGHWSEVDAYDLVMCWAKEEKMLESIDHRFEVRELYKEYLKDILEEEPNIDPEKAKTIAYIRALKDIINKKENK